MIKYSLRCSNGHEFEAWFHSGEAYELQSNRGLINCPDCSDTAIDRQPMAPAILKGRQQRVPLDSVAKRQKQPPVEVLRALKRQVMTNCEDVGSRFAEEARKIHEGEAEERSIRGETTPADAHSLAEDGIPFGVLPMLPEDHN